MNSVKSAQEYIILKSASFDTSVLIAVQEILSKQVELEETIKWGIPCYTYPGKNIIGMAIFKQFTAIWFYHGALLNDHAGVLVNAQEGKTMAQRQWRFSSLKEFNADLVEEYVDQALQLAKNGKFYSFKKEAKKIISPLLAEALRNDAKLQKDFNELSAFKQKEYHEYIFEAKRESTKVSRLEKIIPMIKSGGGLNDKYRK